jgi:hypothetical protein
MSTDINALATQTYREMVKAGMHASPVYLAGHKGQYDFAQAQAEAHEAARDVISCYDIEDTDIANSVELIDVLNIKPPKAEPAKPKPTSNATERRMVVTGLQPSASHVHLVRVDTGQLLAGRLQRSGRLLWTKDEAQALPIDVELRRYWQEILKDQNIETMVIWSFYGA